jgi:putative membrane protein
MSSREPGAHRESGWALVVRWRGIALAAVAIVVTLWLAATGQLILYIHPRYVVFTAIMGVIALALVVASFAVRHGHSHDDAPTRGQKVATIAGAVVTIVLAVAMIVVPPATLSSATAIQRDVGSASATGTGQTVAGVSSASAAAFAKFTVSDWSSLLRQTSDPAFYTGKPADVVGFVTSDSTDPANLFYLTRFVITCCAVDAQPIGVPVYLPDWKQKYPQNTWLRLTGSFVSDPSTKSSEQIALEPAKVAKIAKPKQPYLF